MQLARTITAFCRTPAAVACLAALGQLCAGCAVFHEPVVARPRTAATAALSWLSGWGGQASAKPAFSIETLKPERQQGGVPAGSLLEVTVWNLHEPGQPYTFPVRVSQNSQIELPLAGSMDVSGLTVAECEAAIAHAYRAGEYLVDPKVIVRSLESPTIKVQVQGAVVRPGFVELNREEASVYAALLAAGGLGSAAGTQISIERAGARAPAEELPAGSHAPGIATSGAASGRELSASPGRPAEGRANIVEEVSVPEVILATGQIPEADSDAVPASEASRRSGATAARAMWYDVANENDVQRVKQLRLEEGAIVVVREAVLPVRIAGHVARPGAYVLPSDRPLSVWQALELAGGVRESEGPAEIVLLRPDDEGRRVRHWSVDLARYSEHPPASPAVRPGDVLHVDAQTGRRIRQVVKGMGRRS